MGIFQQFPYTNFHEMNLDQIIKIMREMQDEWTNTKAEWASYKDFIDNYFENLDVSAEVLAALRVMASTGELNNIMDPTIASETAAWLADHITQPTTPAVDTSLSVAGAAADAKVTGDKITALQTDFDNLSESISMNITSDNILDFRTGAGKLPADLNGQKFYFGEGIDFSQAMHYSIPYRLHIDKTDGDLNAIYIKWALANGTVSPTVVTNFTSDVNIPQNAVGIQFGAYGNATASPITNVAIVAHRALTPVFDVYDEAINLWDEHINPLVAFLPDFEYTEYGTPNTGLMGDTLTITGSTYPQYYKYYDEPCSEGDVFIVEGQWYSSGFRPYMLCHDDRVMFYQSGANPAQNTVFRNIIKIPAGVNRIIVNGDVVAGVGLLAKITGTISNYWQGKKIVWFGTSIPAGSNAAADSYPVQIGKMLGAEMHNESVGSSCIRAGSYQHISANDPMGYTGINAETLMLSLSLSSAEKQTFINEWTTKWSLIMTGTIQTSQAWIDAYKNSSWDVKLNKYLTGGSVGQCDLYVFDHGYNDSVYGYGYSDFEIEPTPADDRTYFVGAMNFIVRKILADNPNARILFIGHYNNSAADPFGRGADYNGNIVCSGQEHFAELWGFPIIKTWNLLGLSCQELNNGDTVIETRIPDGLHPASDTTGYMLELYAAALLPHVKNVR